MKDFKDKVLFVTGGASGAGFGQAKVFSEAGCKVVIADVRQDALDRAKAELTGRGAVVHTIKLDITDRAAYAAAADEVEAVFGTPPQILLNTAGVNSFGPPEATTYDDYDWIMGVCLDGVINGMVTFVPRMIKAGLGGYIVSTSSMGGFWGTPITAPYSAAKAAVINLMESYALSLPKYGIGVSVLCPANIRSNIAHSTDTRPAHLSNTGYLVDDLSTQTLQDFYDMGMDPEVLAQHVKKGIEDERLYILPYPEEREALTKHFQIIIDSVLPMETDPEGVAKRMAAFKRVADEAIERAKKDPGQAAQSGFGRARPELDWIKPATFGPPPAGDAK
jgi:NAD(P)-dependent dehydrogenase (short-subunit alcohol dehydrogenase family)